MSHVADHALVQLEHVEFHGGQQGQVGVLGSKVVDGDGKARPADFDDQRPDIQFLHLPQTFRDLDLQELRGNAGGITDFGELLHKQRLRQGAAGEVYGDRKYRFALFHPAFEPGADELEHEEIDLTDSPRLLHQREEISGQNQGVRTGLVADQGLRSHGPAIRAGNLGLQIHDKTVLPDLLL